MLLELKVKIFNEDKRFLSAKLNSDVLGSGFQFVVALTEQEAFALAQVETVV